MPDEISSRTRVRSPAYPAFGLREAITKLNQLFAAEHLTAATVEVAAAAWGYNQGSSAGPAAVSALKQFSLLEDEGRGHDRRVRISELGRELVIEEAGSAEWKRALQRAALSPPIYADLWREFNLRGSDANIRSNLLRRDFNPKAVHAFIRDYRDTVAFAELDETATIPGEPAVSGGSQSSMHTTMSSPTARAENIVNPGRTASFQRPAVQVQSGLPLPIPLPNKQIAIVVIPKMTAKTFDFFKAQLEAYRDAIVEEPSESTPAEVAGDADAT